MQSYTVCTIILATETANRKIRESKEKFPDLDPYDDVFVPAIMETYGLMHTDLRKVLRTLAEKRLSKSGMDTSFSTEEQSILLGSVMNSLYQVVSVAAMRGIVVPPKGAEPGRCARRPSFLRAWPSLDLT